MKKTVVILTFCMLISCSKSSYYAFEEYDYKINNKPYLYSYCTLEITSKKEVVFRGASKKYVIYEKKGKYYYDFYSNFTSYMYIYSDRESSFLDEHGIMFCKRPSECYFLVDDYTKLPTDNKSIFKVASINDFKNWDKKEIFYLYDRKRDSLILSNTDSQKDFIKNDEGLIYANIPWFPPYLVKVKKIDYNKFKEKCPRLKYAHFKNPRKFYGKVLNIDKR